MPFVALPALEGVVAAIIALLVLVGTATLIRAIAGALPDWHIPGFSALRSWVLGSANAFLRWVYGYMSKLVGAVGHVMAYPVLVVERFVSGLRAALSEAATTAEWIAHVSLPLAIRALRVDVVQWVSNARAYAHALVNTSVLMMERWVHAAEHTAAAATHSLRLVLSADIVAARKYASTLVSNLSALVARDVATVERVARSYTDAAIRNLGRTVGDVAAAIAVAKAAAFAYTDRAISALAGTVPTTAAKVAGALITDVDAAAAAAVHDPFTDAIGVVGELEGLIGQALPDLRDALAAVPRALPGDLAAIAATTAALTDVMARYMRTCGIPNCRNLSQFGRDLQGLLGLVGDGAILALFADLAFRPASAAQDVITVLGPVAHGAADAVESVLRAA